ncbi:MAG: hypothetical protein AAGN35_01235 [Bacteroidota bacterium]
MSDQPSTDHWNEREWLAFLLLCAAEADGIEDVREMRLLRVNFGSELIDRMRDHYQGMRPEARTALLRDTLPMRLRERPAREKVQRLLRQVVMADGDYRPEEQALVHRISQWLRGEP